MRRAHCRAVQLCRCKVAPAINERLLQESRPSATGRLRKYRVPESSRLRWPKADTVKSRRPHLSAPHRRWRVSARGCCPRQLPWAGLSGPPTQHLRAAQGVRADALIDEFSHDGALVHLLLRYAQALIAQTAQIAVCNRHHTLEQQLCRWLLGCADRSQRDTISMTQEMISNMLGVRREGVTEAAGHLQQAGMIRYTRGRIAVLDRPGLEARACECRKVVRREYARLIPAPVPASLS